MRQLFDQVGLVIWSLSARLNKSWRLFGNSIPLQVLSFTCLCCFFVTRHAISAKDLKIF